MRTQANGFDLVPSERSQIFHDGVLPIWRRYAKLRTQMYPYLAAAQRVYDRTGLPMMRSLALMHPGDRRGAGLEDEYLFGPDLLVAPVVDEGARRRGVYLPRGRWVNFWRAVRYLKKSGGFALRGAKTLRGTAVDDCAGAAGAAADVRARRRRAADASRGRRHAGGLWTRAGSGPPARPARADDAAGVPAREVQAGDRRRRGRRVARVARRLDAGVGGRRVRRYSLQASLATLRRPFIPCAVSVNGDRLPRSEWSFSRKTKVLRVTFRMERGRVAAHRCRAVALPGR